MKINNRSDFQLLLTAEDGKTFPTFDFTLVFKTTGGYRYYVQSTDAVRFVPNEARTEAVVTFDFADGNYFPNGKLTYTIKAKIPNEMFPDGYENTQNPQDTNIEIWDGQSDYDEAVKVDFVLPIVKGDKGDKGDKGEQGERGEKGDKGDTPQRGVDYWTDADKEAIDKDVQQMVAEQFPVNTNNIADNAVTDIKIDEAYRLRIANAAKVTYADLKDMRDNGKLIAGQSYRITDFVTTTAQAETQSAGHAFDIVLVALDEHTLNETAMAVQHEGDDYFANCHLESWTLKYCLDNDTTRFAWADDANGKGVIYYMRDEFNNECPYDFKNIQFKLYAGTGSGWTSYLSSIGVSASSIVPYRLTLAFNGQRIGKYTWNINADDYTYAYTYSGYNRDYKTTFDKSLGGEVHNCRIGNNWATIQQDDTETYNVLSLNFIIAIPFLLSQKDDAFTVYGNDFGINCHYIVLSNNCYSNKLGDICYNIHITRGCHSWTCGNNCHSWTCGNDCHSWTCGNNCHYWTCGNDCHSWTCGNNCHSWSCVNNCYYWTCGNYCYSWTCWGNNCYGWNCGNYSSQWSCAANCYGWNCGNYSSQWSCGNNCYEWTCGNHCYGWSCSNNCYNWSCGNNCSYWKIGTSKVLKDYALNFRLENDTKNLYIYSTITPTSVTPLQNFVIKNGIQGVDYNNRLDVIIDNEKFPLNADYEWIIAKNSKGEIVQYCEADLVQ